MTAKPTGAWAPFHHAAFTMLWVAQLVSNLGSWMQSVGAQWFLVREADSTALVAWVQTASQAPVLLLSVLAGVLADGLNRRLLLIGTNAASVVVAAALFALAATGALTPATLLAGTFLLGCSSALGGPGWQAIQPELVPRDEIPAASSLGSVTVNGARVIGPAIAGAIIAASGPAPVFALNAVSFAAVVLALVLWRERSPSTRTSREPFAAAVAAGLRYVRAAPGVRRILLRAGLFVVPASAFWALLPVVVSGRLRLGADGYGLLLGALGAGSLIGVLSMPWVRAHLSSSTVLGASAVLFGLTTAAAALAALPVVVALLVVGGAAWIGTLTTLNATLQLTVADWVRARALGVYFVVFVGGQGVASFLWGLLAERLGAVPTLLTGAALLVVVGASVRWLPLRRESGTLDRRVVPAGSNGPAQRFEPRPRTAMVVRTTYTVPKEDRARFEEAMRQVELSRRRRGAYLWRLERSASEPDRYQEDYGMRSAAEHRRASNERRTGYDAEVIDAVAAWRSDESTWFDVSPSHRRSAPAGQPDERGTGSGRARVPAPRTDGAGSPA